MHQLESRIRRIFPLAPPVTSQTEFRGPVLLYMICWVWATVLTLNLALQMTHRAGFMMRGATSILAIDTFIGVSLLLNFKGYFRPAAIFFTLSLWSVCSLLAFTGGGIASQAVVVYLPLTVAVGVLLGGMWGIGMTILSILTVLVMVLMSIYGTLPASRTIHTPISLWIGYSLSGMLIAGTQYLAAWQSKLAFDQIRKEVEERQKAEAIISALNESLEEKVMERTEELREANQSLETFNYTVSHDLQAPLRVVNGYSKIMQRVYEDKLDDEGKHFLRVIHTSVSGMSQLIKDLLEFSKSGKGTLRKQNVDMRNVVDGIIGEAKSGEKNYVAKIVVGDLEPCLADANLIRQVWTNLILNALKYSSKKKEPVIKIGSTVNGNELVYYVKDNGAGFDMQYVSQIFDVFERLHASTEFEGTGIGLATTQRIVSRHGGKIWAESKLNEGATFYFTLS